MKKTMLLLAAAIFLAACNCSGGKDNVTPVTPKDQTEPETPAPEDPAPEEPESLTVRLGTYNIGNFNKAETNSTEMVAAMMKEIGVQALSLNELDYFNNRHNVDQVKAFAACMGGWNGLFAPAIDYAGGKYGVGIASAPELEIVKTETLTLPKGDGSEQRALAVVEFESFVFASTHLDHKSKTAQLDQAKTIDAWVESHYGLSPKPVFLCGDFNALPDSETLQYMKGSWFILSPLDPTYSAKNPTKCIDYIMVYKNAAAKVGKLGGKVCSVFRSGDVTVASDHLPVYVEVKITL